MAAKKVESTCHRESDYEMIGVTGEVVRFVAQDQEATPGDGFAERISRGNDTWWLLQFQFASDSGRAPIHLFRKAAVRPVELFLPVTSHAEVQALLQEALLSPLGEAKLRRYDPRRASMTCMIKKRT